MFNVLSDGKIVLINVINGYYKIPNIKQTLSYELAQYDESIRSYAYDNITIEEGDELVDDPNNYEITGIKQFYQIDGYLMHMYNSTTKIVACDTLIGEGMKNYIALTRTDTLKYANLKLYDDAKHIAEYFQMLIIRKAIIFNSLELYDVVSNFIVKVLGNIKK